MCAEIQKAGIVNFVNIAQHQAKHLRWRKKPYGPREVRNVTRLVPLAGSFPASIRPVRNSELLGCHIRCVNSLTVAICEELSPLPSATGVMGVICEYCDWPLGSQTRGKARPSRRDK